MKYLFSSGVWGASYIDKFLAYSLPTQLTDGNLIGFPDLDQCRYQIITGRDEEAAFRASPIFQRLNALMETEFVHMEEFVTFDPEGDKYSLMGQCQSEAIRRAAPFDALFMGYADFIWADGSLQAAARRIAEGYEAVFAPGLPVIEDRFVEETLNPALAAAEDKSDKTLSVSSRDLVAASLRHLHPMAEENYSDREWQSEAPAYRIWKVPGEGVIMRWFHLHPVVMRTTVDGAPVSSDIKVSLDDDFVDTAFHSTEKLYFMTDSDEGNFCSLMPYWEPERSIHRNGALSLARWAENYTGFIHRQFYDVPFLFHYKDMDPAIWQPIEQASRAYAAEVQKRLLLPDSVAAATDAHSFWSRRQRQSRKGLWFFQAASGLTVMLPDMTAGQLIFVLLQRLWGNARNLIGRLPVIGGALHAGATRRAVNWVRQNLLRE